VLVLQAALHWLNGSACCTLPVRPPEALQALQDRIWRLRVRVEGEMLKSRARSGPDSTMDAPAEESIYETEAAPAGVRGWGTCVSLPTRGGRPALSRH